MEIENYDLIRSSWRLMKMGPDTTVCHSIEDTKKQRNKHKSPRTRAREPSGRGYVWVAREWTVSCARLRDIHVTITLLRFTWSLKSKHQLVYCSTTRHLSSMLPHMCREAQTQSTGSGPLWSNSYAGLGAREIMAGSSHRWESNPSILIVMVKCGVV